MKRFRKVPISKTFRDFCESTSLDGYKYLYISNFTVVKVIWAIIILTISSIGIGLVVSNTDQYLKSRLTTSIEPSTASLNVSNFYIQKNRNKQECNTVKVLCSDTQASQ